MKAMPVEDRWIDLRGVRFHYRDWGGEGRAIVLLHGLASTSHIWNLVAPILAERARVVALDQRGHGLTDKPPSGYGFDDIRDDLFAFLETLAFSRPLLVGHSWGASVVMVAAAARPNEVAGIAMVDGGFFDMRGRMTWEEAEKRMAPPVLDGLTRSQFAEMAREWLVGPEWSDDVEAAVLANFEEQPDGTIRPRFPRDRHMQVVRAMWELSTSDLLPRLRCPTLLVPAYGAAPAGAAEFVAMKRGAVERAAAAIPEVSVVPMEHSVHDIPLHYPRELAATILEFSERLDGRAPGGST